MKTGVPLKLISDGDAESDACEGGGGDRRRLSSDRTHARRPVRRLRAARAPTKERELATRVSPTRAGRRRVGRVRGGGIGGAFLGTELRVSSTAWGTPEGCAEPDACARGPGPHARAGNRRIRPHILRIRPARAESAARARRPGRGRGGG